MINKPPLHNWDLTPSEAIALQRELAGRVRVQPLPMRFDVLGAADIGYSKASGLLAAVVCTFSWPELDPLESVHVVRKAGFPYIPGLLSFRETPPVVEAWQKLERPAQVLLCDGQGIAHPRRLGFASHLGLTLGIPTVGCAKSRLCGDFDPLPAARGARSPLTLQGDIVGCAFRSRDNVKPLFISPGHLSDIESSVALVSACLGRYRIPEPQRRAHNLATHLRREIPGAGQ
jgi:deoxyribonuclease V